MSAAGGLVRGMLGAVLLVAACAGEEGERAAGDAGQRAATAPEAIDTQLEAPGTRGADIDRRLFEEKLAWAREQRLDTLPIGSIVARLGRTFVGTSYVPHTLDPPGPERLVVNLRELDCVTFVENVLAMARLIRAGESDWDGFLAELERIRYRGGRLGGYPSRLHYFSEWISDGEEKGLVRDVTRELGGQPDPGPLDFMTSHATSYRALQDPENLAEIRRMEERLSERRRFYIPQAEIARAERGIRDGDIIAATSAVDGLDIAHTGFALRIGGRIHLMHAPLVGDSVQVSGRPLADRIRSISGQDGVMVARPL